MENVPLLDRPDPFLDRVKKLDRNLDRIFLNSAILVGCGLLQKINLENKKVNWKRTTFGPNRGGARPFLTTPILAFIWELRQFWSDRVLTKK